MDMEQLQTILNLGSFEQARTDRALNEYKVVGTVIDVPCEGYQPWWFADPVRIWCRAKQSKARGCAI